jgi:hypothetical protein
MKRSAAVILRATEENRNILKSVESEIVRDLKISSHEIQKLKEKK